MNVDALIVGPLQVNCYIVSCSATREAVVIDAGDDAERILAFLQQNDLVVKMILNTHGHFDHQGGIKALVEATGAPFLLHRADLPVLERSREHAALYGLNTTQAPTPDRFLEDGEELAFGQETLKVMHTPGHSPGGVCFYGGGHLFCGDTLFAGSVGRTDLPLGDHDRLIQSIRESLLPLDETTEVHPGHGPDTTIGREKLVNPFITG